MFFSRRMVLEGMFLGSVVTENNQKIGSVELDDYPNQEVERSKLGSIVENALGNLLMFLNGVRRK
jgi:hypothetical protein